MPLRSAAESSAKSKRQTRVLDERAAERYRARMNIDKDRRPHSGAQNSS